jgi:iron complex transport system ATP-binding protein
LPPSGKATGGASEEEIQPKVHVMAGGGSGALMMRALADARIPFDAGVLNIGDSDYTLALRLANNVITEQPYAPISSANVEQVRTSLQHVALLILCPMPIGPGNLALLQEAVQAAQRGLPVLLLAPTENDMSYVPNAQTATADERLQRTGIAARDYTGGQGVKLTQMLLQYGAHIVGSVGEALEVARGYVILAQ